MPVFSFRDVAGDPNVLKTVLMGGDTLNTGLVGVGVASAPLIGNNTNRIRLFLKNKGSVSVYISGVSPATTSSYELAAGETSPPIHYQGPLYAIAASGTQNVLYFEECT